MKAHYSMFLLLLLIGVYSRTANGYELATHGHLSYEAYRRSVLVDARFVKELGIANGKNPFGTVYYDRSGDTVTERSRQLFEQDRGRMPPGTEPLSIEGWLMRGAIREDDSPGEDNPSDDPEGEIVRVFRHFYDPSHDRPLNLKGAPLPGAEKAPDWAIGTKDAFKEPNVPQNGRRNHFTMFDAREALYRALTGKKKDETKIEATRAERNKYWATTFRALGDVVHLIQDMAQPQHTRNDWHAGRTPELLTGHSSVYEKNVDARATGDPARRRDVQQLDPSIETFSPLSYTLPNGAPYPAPRFPEYNDFFSTQDRDTAAQGLGLADYSNRGFFTAGTNLGDNDYALPPNDRRQFAEQVISVNSDTKTVYLLDGVFDRLNPALRALDVPKTKESLWHEPLLEFADAGIAETVGYALDQRIYDAQADLLIPRAVAYSAGLIDYFFRGRLDVVDPTFTDEGVSLKVRNAIDAEKVPEWAEENLHAQKGQGQFVVTVKYKLGEEEKLITSNPVNLTTQEYIAPGETADEVLSFQLPPLPDDATNVEYRLVFRGRLGQEDDAIAVGLVEPASGFIVTPNYVPTDGIAGRRLIVRSSGKWRATEDRNLQGGNIDWKGWYENGKPTKVLSWRGPRARHFPDNASEDPFSPSIYQNGELFAASLLDVLGAAIAKDVDGKEWLMVIAKSNVGELVLKRPNKKSTSAGFYDPVTRPDGWQVIGNFPWESDFKPPSRPWFFNGDGTEAQTMRGINASEPNKLDRLQIRISPDLTSADLVNLGNLEGVKGAGIDAQRMIKGDRSCDWSRETSSAGSGNYIVAVDYQDQKELLCVLAREVKVSSSWRKAFSGSGVSHVTTYTTNHRRVESNILTCGTLQLELNHNIQNELTDITQTATGVSGSKKHSSESERHWVNYLDPRDNLIVTSYSGSQFELSLTPMGSPTFDVFTLGLSYYQGLGTISSTSRERDLIRRGAVSVTAFDFAKTTTGDAARIAFEVIAGTCVDSESSRTSAGTSYPGVIVDPRTQGSWAIDSNGNLAVSQTKGANHLQEGSGSQFGTGEFFNFVTGGKLETAIPGAPENSRYFPIYTVN